MTDNGSYFLDYTLELTERSRVDLDGFWGWYRSDNQLLGEVRGQLQNSKYLHTRVSQRVYTTIQGRANTILERIEVRGLEGISNYFLGLNEMKANIPRATDRLDEFYRWIEISRLQIRTSAPSFDPIDLGAHKVVLAQHHRYLHTARARPSEFFSTVAGVDSAIRQAGLRVSGIQNYTELVGSHGQYTRWLAFDDVSDFYRYVRSEQAREASSALAPWLEPIDNCLLEEVSPT